MKLAMRSRLSLMMFLEYFVWGSWYVTMGTFLGTGLNASGIEIGLAYGTGAIAAMISPFFVGLIADRFFPSERVLGVLHLLGAALLYMAASSDNFNSFYWFILLYNLTYFPTIALTNSIAFHQMKDPESEFSSIRVLGTLGWITIGMVIMFLQSTTKLGLSFTPPFFLQAEQYRNIEGTSLPFMIGAGSALLMGIYSFTLPHTPPSRNKKEKISFREIIGLDAIGLLKDRSFLVLFIASVLISIPLMFYFSLTNVFLNEIQFENAAGKMNLGQVSEMVFLLVMPFFFKRLGVKKMILVGMAAWVLRYTLFAYGDTGPMVWMLYAGIILHGICYDFFFVTGQIYADNRAPINLRSSVQGMMTFATYGVGFFVGSLLSGATSDFYTMGEGVHNWQMIWLLPAAFAAAVAIFFALLFRDNQTAETPATASTSDLLVEGE